MRACLRISLELSITSRASLPKRDACILPCFYDQCRSRWLPTTWMHRQAPLTCATARSPTSLTLWRWAGQVGYSVLG